MLFLKNVHISKVTVRGQVSKDRNTNTFQANSLTKVNGARTSDNRIKMCLLQVTKKENNRRKNTSKVGEIRQKQTLAQECICFCQIKVLYPMRQYIIQALFIDYYYYFKMSKISSLIFTLLLLVFSISQECCKDNIVDIIGAGVVEVDPDTAIFYVTATVNGATSVQALSNANTLIGQTTNVLLSLGLSSSSFSTLSINLYPLYNYTNGAAYLIGQQASQILQVTVSNINENKNLLGGVAGNLSTINNLSISGFSFRNSNQTQAVQAARRAAVADAISKSNQYALFSGKNLGPILSIWDLNTETYTTFDISAPYYSFRQSILNVPFGKVQVAATVEVKWRLRS